MAESSFNRILTLLRKERGITQKQASQALGVSQALLSHYEKGIRECGLDFVVRAADYYGVSCDYLLGRSADRSGLTLSVEDIPDEADPNDKKYTGSVLSTLNKKLLANSLNVVYGILQKCGDKALIGDVSDYLFAAIYKVFRALYAANAKNQDDLFSVGKRVYAGFADAAMSRAQANMSLALSGDKPGSQLDPPHLTTESINKDYPMFASSLFNLIQTTEKKIGK